MNRIEVSKLEFIKIEPRGKGVAEKFWVYKDEIKKLVKESDFELDQDLMEYLSSIILKKINIDTVDVELGYDSLSKKNCCLINNFLKEESEVSYQITNWSRIVGGSTEREIELSFKQVFNSYNKLYDLSENELEQMKRDYIRVIFGKCIIENSDSKLSNVDLIFNEKTKKYRLSPSYDNGFAFNEYNSICEPKCCVGNQYFNMIDVIKYIINNFFQYVRDIPELLDNFVEDDLIKLLNKLSLEIKEEKKNYIIAYLKKVNKFIQNSITCEKRIK